MGDDDMIRSTRHGVWGRGVLHGIALLGLLGTVGCEQLSSLVSGRSQSKPSSGTATAAVATSKGFAVPTPPPVLPGDVVASVNGVPLLKAQVELRVRELKALVGNLGQEWTPLSAAQLQAVLEELVKTELMSQEAVARGLDRALDVQRRWEFMRRGFFAQEWLRWNQERLTVSSEEVEQYYTQNTPGFREPERVRLRQITLESEEQAKKALAQLLQGTAEFAALAQQISLAPTASEGGLLSSWVMRANEKAFVFASEAEADAAGVSSLDPVLEAAAFAVDQVNGFSSYVKGADNRYHIFQLVERQAERQRPITDVWDAVKTFLLTQKLDRAITELSGKATIERFTDRLEGISQ